MKLDGRIPYLDYLNTKGLKKKYARNADAGLVSPEKLVEVDLVADGRPLDDILETEGLSTTSSAVTLSGIFQT